jgi:hypothetical protein
MIWCNNNRREHDATYSPHRIATGFAITIRMKLQANACVTETDCHLQFEDIVEEEFLSSLSIWSQLDCFKLKLDDRGPRWRIAAAGLIILK